MEFFRFDPYYYSRNRNFYRELFHGKRFVDATGRLFTAAGLRYDVDVWSKLGIRAKHEVRFVPANERWEFAQVRTFLMERVAALEGDACQAEWLAALEKATTIKQLIESERN